ncbi:hypothetical protein NIES593_19920 [Hydrococcus rivularis NIES-593]|uniref:Glycosyltransferase n=1 Tax=Hydrococcus rivularis NIES-593 TaxID=1921803 RepID=A0A1U7H982_9CYAN|nr:hypothetical protein [Hydrococcus rivularis]OKH20157.1 hypothetical protein NIES593_19920 [Hydrococcus rivularis NIES-593]
MTERAAILIVNGGKDPKQGKWIELCINKILEHTKWSNYHIYVWNNNLEDTAVVNFLKSIPLVTLIQANPGESLAHVHAVPLQRLYELALQNRPKYIVAMDSDAHPIQDGWLTKLISSLDKEVVLAGVWRDELKKAITPYIHASCLCTTVDFIESNNLRLDFIAPNTKTEIHDTLSVLTEKAKELNLKMFKLCRSNKNNFHRLMGGIYGDLIYHHGAGSRVNISFWDEAHNESNVEKNKQLVEIATNLVFTHYFEYIQWLQGHNQEKNFEAMMLELKKLERRQFKPQNTIQFSWKLFERSLKKLKKILINKK